MFRSVLIANRGEIACRIARSLRKLGVRSIAIHSEADAQSSHVSVADVAVCVGPAPASDSYLNVPAILEAARHHGAEAVHPGYGFLSENADFAEAVEASGMAFIGPTPDQIRKFGLKHTARELAERASAPLLPGTGLLADADEALRESERIGFPVMLKSTAGGGGIGLQICRTPEELTRAFESVKRLGQSHFKHAGAYVEKYVAHARHVEVQVFGDGRGRVVALGERDCSVQRRNQKVVEETPAPALADAVRQALASTAVRLMEAVRYRSAGTVEFVVDADTGDYYFLEVNTRLQVEHCVTEEVRGVDLVEWMVRTAAKEAPPLDDLVKRPRGHSIEVRVYAEDPGKGFQPSAGLLTEVAIPESVRWDGWVARGTTVTPYYDPLLGKLVVWGETRPAAIEKLRKALGEMCIAGIETNLDLLRHVAESEPFAMGAVTTSFLGTLDIPQRGIDVLSPGTQTTVQDYPGRVGYWAIGVPPSGPMDARSHRLGNRLVGNTARAASLEITMTGPTLRFRVPAIIALSGAQMEATLDGAPVPHFTPILVDSGQTLALGAIRGGGARTYLCIRGGFDVPEYLSSRSTFTLGGFGGHGGRALRTGDVLHVGSAIDETTTPQALPPELIPTFGNDWEIGVIEGPHAAPDFFAEEFARAFYDVGWKVHYNSARTGVRLVGPKPIWTRPDGGEAGLHPSNIHDTAYAIGSVDFTGDMPILLGPDGPSLGGFVCPATVVASELWKLGQLRPGDSVRFQPRTLEQALADEERMETEIATLLPRPTLVPASVRTPAVVFERPETTERFRFVVRRAGDRNLLVEFGPMALDLTLRLQVHLLMGWLESRKIPGVLDLTPGIRSLQIQYDGRRITEDRLVGVLREADQELSSLSHPRVPSRVIRMPLSWDDPATQLAISKYVQSVRPDAPWAPSNIEFIRRINGLEDTEAVRRIVFGASYLVLGLGDVYLGAPVATPVDPRHRLVTTKYNPARTWTPENAVGIGGAYLCIYGMEGPGGYQFVGRTLQVYNRWNRTRSFRDEPWLLRFFDRIEFYPVDSAELLEMREAFAAGRHDVEIQDATFDLAEYRALLEENAASIASFKARQQAAFDAERTRWIEQGLLQFSSEDARGEDELSPNHAVPDGARGVESHVSGSVWKIVTEPGSRVESGSALVVVESMKMEVTIEAPVTGTVVEVLCREGRPVSAGNTLVVLRPD